MLQALLALGWRHAHRYPQPQRVEVTIEGVCLTRGIAAAGRAARVYEVLAFGQRIACASGGQIQGQDHRQLLDLGTGTAPQLSQYTIGIGVPQERCLEMVKSLAL